MATIIPAILTADEEMYQRRLLAAEHVADLIQVDIIDGMFAKNTTIGAATVKKFPTVSFLEIQLMVLYPQNYIDELVNLEYVSKIIVPFEVHGPLPEAIYHIKNHGKQVGLSLNPETPVSAVIHFLDDIDLLLLLAVEPGFSGQEFQEKVIDKVKEAKKIFSELAVEVDGGINFDNAAQIAHSGADFLAVNSALYEASDFRIAFEKLAKISQNRNN